MAVHPLVPDEADTPFNAFRLKLAIHLFTICRLYLPKSQSKTYLLYLQRYFLCKSTMDLATLYDYEAMLKKFSKLCTPIKSYLEADNLIATIEANVKELKPHTYMLSLAIKPEEEEEEVDSISLTASQEVQPKEAEIDEQFEKKYNELMKPTATPLANRRVNLDNMILPMELQNQKGNGKYLLLQKPKGVKMARVNVNMTEEEKKRLMNHAKYQERENRRMKQITLKLNQAQELDTDTPSVEQIHNERIPVCPQANGKKWKK